MRPEVQMNLAFRLSGTVLLCTEFVQAAGVLVPKVVEEQPQILRLRPPRRTPLRMTISL
jgi:hypothetical protein